MRRHRLTLHFLQVSAAMGFFRIPWAMLGEVYATEVAGFACGVATCLGNVFGFAAINLFPTLVLLTGGTISSTDITCTEGVLFLWRYYLCCCLVHLLIPSWNFQKDTSGNFRWLLKAWYGDIKLTLSWNIHKSSHKVLSGTQSHLANGLSAAL
jgi:nitrate/nitrite transporter NarK